MERKRFSWIKRIAAPFIIMALLILLVGHLQAVSDYIRLYNYQPPADVAALSAQTTMTDYARKLFYINHPEVADRSTFNAACSNEDEQTIVLGCYHPVDRGIYVYAISDPRLNGVEQVTAAHEMLHAAYDRLSSGEKATVDAELQQFYDTDEHDPRIRATIAAYQKTEPNDVVNEMHSIFGTEVGSLTPELETYYKKYFTNRSTVVQFAASYQQEFTSREDQVKADDATLKKLKTEIDANTASLSSGQSAITAMQRQMEDERAAGDYSGYNSNVPVYNAKVDSYNSLVRATQADITEYNQLVSERNKLVLQVQQLTQSINSQPTPIGQ